MYEKINISVGELWDKYSILLIKKQNIQSLEKRKHVECEINFLKQNMDKYSYIDHPLFFELKDINHALWEIEDKIRVKEKMKCFDEEFILLARSVYITNDKRHEVKNKINIHYGSDIFEVKDYVK